MLFEEISIHIYIFKKIIHFTMYETEARFKKIVSS